jgi:hypothetical protein
MPPPIHSSSYTPHHPYSIYSPAKGSQPAGGRAGAASETRCARATPPLRQGGASSAAAPGRCGQRASCPFQRASRPGAATSPWRCRRRPRRRDGAARPGNRVTCPSHGRGLRARPPRLPGPWRQAPCHPPRGPTAPTRSGPQALGPSESARRGIRVGRAVRVREPAPGEVRIVVGAHPLPPPARRAAGRHVVVLRLQRRRYGRAAAAACDDALRRRERRRGVAAAACAAACVS